MDLFLAVLNRHALTEAQNKKVLTVCDDALEVVGKRPVNGHSDDGAVVSPSILVSPSESRDAVVAIQDAASKVAGIVLVDVFLVRWPEKDHNWMGMCDPAIFLTPGSLSGRPNVVSFSLETEASNVPRNADCMSGPTPILSSRTLSVSGMVTTGLRIGVGPNV